MYLKTVSPILFQKRNSTLVRLLGVLGFASILACETPQNAASAADRPTTPLAQPAPSNATYEGEKVYELFDATRPPSFPGGDTELLRYIANKLQYPSKARIMGTQGSVILSFIVTKSGEIKDITIKKDIGNGCGEAAVRVFEAMPNWVPGEHFGTAVHVRTAQPVYFKYQ